MLLLVREKNGKHIEVHTSAQGKNYYCVEIYDCTPHGKICEKSINIERDVFDLITD